MFTAILCVCIGVCVCVCFLQTHPFSCMKGLCRPDAGVRRFQLESFSGPHLAFARCSMKLIIKRLQKLGIDELAGSKVSVVLHCQPEKENSHWDVFSASMQSCIFCQEHQRTVQNLQHCKTTGMLYIGSGRCRCPGELSSGRLKCLTAHGLAVAASWAMACIGGAQSCAHFRMLIAGPTHAGSYGLFGSIVNRMTILYNDM